MFFGMFLIGLANADSCAANQSFQATVAEIRESPEEYTDKCVTVVGFTDGLAMFDTNLAKQRVSKYLRQGRSVADFDRQVGVYFPTELDDVELDETVRWTVTGQVDSCERLIERAEERIAKEPKEEGVITFVMPSGFCHSRHGPVILATTAVPTSDSN